MGEANIREQAIATMPRGGPDASWLDRRFQTDALEYLDRDDVPDEVKQKIIGVLDRVGTLTNLHEKYARIALKLVSDIPNPRILELGAGHGKLSAKILELHPTATVTISDLDPTSVANIAAGELGTHPRARTQVIDATAIDGHDHSYDLAVFALAFHHLPPTVACKAIAEATRVGEALSDHRPQTAETAVVHALFGAATAAPPTAAAMVVDALEHARRLYQRTTCLQSLGVADACPRRRSGNAG